MSGRRKKGYAAETAAEASQAEAMGLDPNDADDFPTESAPAETEEAVPVAA